jgi:hypothetical protein
MGLIRTAVLSILGVVAAILIPVAARIISDDAKEWLPWITRRLIERAVSRLPEGERERLEEEWSSHVNEWPGGLAKIYVAYGYLSASKSIAKLARFGESRPRITDRVLAAVILLFMSVMFPIVGLLIKLDSPGPIFSMQRRRRGLNNEVIRVLKFRTVYVRGDDLSTAPSMAQNDRRITRIGRVLRAQGLDELPQLINVLRGDLSLAEFRASLVRASIDDRSDAL